MGEANERSDFCEAIYEVLTEVRPEKTSTNLTAHR